MLVNSGLINGRESVFVVPAEMPVAKDAIPMSFGDRQWGWGQIAMAMVSELSDELVIDDLDVPVLENNERAGCTRDADGAIRTEERNPYAWADKDVAWQAGIS